MKTGRKLFAILVLVLLVVFVFPAAVSADPVKGGCKATGGDHDWQFVYDSPASCTWGGQKTWQCTKCNEIHTERGEPLGHTFAPADPVKEPTCTEDGLYRRFCTRCEQEIEETIPALGHNWDGGKTTTAATCTANGVKTITCKRCGATKTESIPALGHSWDGGKETTAPTCIKEGVKTYTCARCGSTKTEAIAKTGHKPTAVKGKEPTCEEEGLTDGEKCSVCGETIKAQEKIPAKGHDWDEGKITTEPKGFTAGVKTYTCRNDPKHTKIETVDPIDWIFAYLHGTKMTTRDNLSPLVITQQPQGGTIRRDTEETFKLTVAASGGTEPYTYCWYSKTRFKGWAALWNWPEYLGVTSNPEFEATAGNRDYWVVVRDAEEKTVASEIVTVGYRMTISEQPKNVNIHDKDTVWLKCAARDGSGDYQYLWYYNDNFDQPAYLHDECEVAETGKYVCKVIDSVTGDEEFSEPCEVYDTEPLCVHETTARKAVWPGDPWEVEASVEGGVAPYEVQWEQDGEPLATTQGEDDSGGRATYRAVGYEAGKYTVRVTDAMGETVTAGTYRYNKKLTIKKQPVGGALPKKNGNIALTVEVSDGVAPYRYELYRNGKSYVGGDSNTLHAWDPGEYYFYIEDSEGHSTTSDSVMVEDVQFKITSQTETAKVRTPGGTVPLQAVADGGAEPYDYHWLILTDGYWRRYSEEMDNTMLVGPGYYICEVTDASGKKIWTKPISVTYSGSVPYITLQPKGGVLGTQGDSITLRCEAVSGSGDNENLRYDWQRNMKESGTGGWQRWSFDSSTCKVTTPGVYRCKITDTATGEVAYSRNVPVSNPLKAEIAKLVSNLGEPYSLKVTVKGGLSPYYVQVYRVYEDDSATCIDYRFVSKKDGYTEIDIRNEKPGKIDLTINPYRFRYEKVRFRVVVTDAAGNRTVMTVDR